MCHLERDTFSEAMTHQDKRKDMASRIGFFGVDMQQFCCVSFTDITFLTALRHTSMVPFPNVLLSNKISVEYKLF